MGSLDLYQAPDESYQDYTETNMETIARRTSLTSDPINLQALVTRHGEGKNLESFFLQIVMSLDDSGKRKRESVFLEYFKQ
jgi:hypothetical protein